MKHLTEYEYYLKLYEYHKDIDPFGEEDWDETEPDGTFLSWLKQNYPNKITWKYIKHVNCSNIQLTSLKGIKNLKNLKILWCRNNQLTSLEGIENLKNLKELNCSLNKLTSLEGIENLKNLKEIWCFNNQFNKDYKKYLKIKYKNIKLMV